MKRIPLSLILGFVLLVSLGYIFHLFDPQELGFLDLRFKLRGPQPPHPEIVIVEIDDESINRISHWPWPRSYHATLLNLLSSYEPRLIFYDVLFTEESTQPSDDQLLAYAIKKAGNVIAAFFYHSEEPFIGFFPIASFKEAARYLGFVNIESDSDARVRRIRQSIHPKEGTYYHSSAVAALGRFSDPKEGLQWLEKIPVDRDHSFLINYPGDYSLFERIPFYWILEQKGKNDDELRRLFKGKILLVGQTATGGGDFRPTPFSSAYPGVGIQAAAIHTLLTGKYLRRFDGFESVAILFLLTTLTVLLSWKHSPRIVLISISILSILYFAWNFLVFKWMGWIFPVFPILVSIWGTCLLMLFIQFIELRMEGRLFSRELALASRIQESFLPKEIPQVEGLDLGFQCRFSRVVGGDLYDWVSLGKKRLGICVGDVSGKGIPAALYMARAISEWRTLAKDFHSASALLEALNKRLLLRGADGVFVTFLYLILDLDSGTAVFSNAGHEPFLFSRARSHQTEWIRTASAQPLGLFPDIFYPEEKFSLNDEDSMLLISDGAKELRNPKGEEFGRGGLEKAFVSASGELADETVRQIFRSMDRFSNGNSAHDDRTILCIKVTQGGAG